MNLCPGEGDKSLELLLLLTAFPSHWKDFSSFQRFFIICLYPRADGIGNRPSHQSSSLCFAIPQRDFHLEKRRGDEAEPPGHFQGFQTGMGWEKTLGSGWAEPWSLWSLENPWCPKKPFLLLFQLNFLLSSFQFCPS